MLFATCSSRRVSVSVSISYMYYMCSACNTCSMQHQQLYYPQTTLRDQRSRRGAFRELGPLGHHINAGVQLFSDPHASGRHQRSFVLVQSVFDAAHHHDPTGVQLLAHPDPCGSGSMNM